MENQEFEDKTKIGEYYGYKANPRQNVRDLPWYFQFLEKLNLPTVTTKRVIIFVTMVVLIPLAVIFYLQGDMLKLKYLLPPLLLISLSIVGYLILYSLVNSYNGSLLKSTHIVLTQTFKRILVLLGNAERDIENGVHTVHNDGTIIFSNGQIGRAFAIDGSTSATAFPSEIAIQEQKAKKFHHSRLRTTTIIQITSSQKQNAENQILTAVNLQRSNTNKAIIAMMRQEEAHLRDNIDNKMPTAVQHQIYMDKRQSDLKDSIQKLYRFEAQGYYNSVIPLDNKEDVHRLLGNMLKFK
ncbi:hypothetical protein [Staphylococcus cohnii]|uniref:hypothetical protein n=1 Tax=Staphylococcus cohnii TaxID=29382 RepID=UPI003CF95B67